jgi:hypothetical protein
MPVNTVEYIFKTHSDDNRNLTISTEQDSNGFLKNLWFSPHSTLITLELNILSSTQTAQTAAPDGIQTIVQQHPLLLVCVFIPKYLRSQYH